MNGLMAVIQNLKHKLHNNYKMYFIGIGKR